MRRRTLSANIIMTLCLIFLFIIVVLPFYWIFSSSVKAPQEIIARTPTIIPNSFTLQHYDKLFGASEFPIYMWNSIIVSLGTMVITVILSTSAAYGLYRLRLPGRNFIFQTILITYAFPGILLLIPLYGMMSRVGIVDTLLSLVVINVTLAAPFAVWMMRAFLSGIPEEIEDAAALDGANSVQILLRVLLPLAAPGVASIAIFAFIMSWTEYMFASVLIISDDKRTLPVGLAGIIGQYQIDWGLLLAGASLTALPVIILFSFVGRSFVRGLTAGAMK
jgi:ABC-type glycerol-3-phosphate transport system permease component